MHPGIQLTTWQVPGAAVVTGPGAAVVAGAGVVVATVSECEKLVSPPHQSNCVLSEP